jgi:putative MATE family efflux protein
MWAAIWVIAWPVLTESILNALVGLVDTTLAAGLSEAATDAVGVAAYFQWLIGLAPVAVGIGSTALISRAFGRGRIAVANAALGQALSLSLALGAVLAVILIIAAPALARTMSLGDQPDAFRYTVEYLRIVSLGIPFSACLFAGIAGCRGAGDALRPMWVMAAINLVNTVSSFLLSGVDLATSELGADGIVHSRVFLANPLSLDMGVRGIALGTLLAWIVGAALMGIVLIRGTHGLRLRFRRLRPHWHTMRRLVRVAAPNLLESLGMWLGNFLVLLMVGWMNQPGLYGAHIVAIRIESLSYLLGFAMAAASATLTGQYLGAGAPKLAQAAALRCTAVSVAVMGTIGLTFALMPEAVVGVFSQQPTHLQYAPTLLILCGLAQIPFAIAIVLRGSLYGAGDTRVVMFLTLFTIWIVRLPAVWLCSGVEVPLWNGAVLPNPAPLQRMWDIPPLVGLWIGLCGELVIRPILFVARFLHGGWKTARV